MTRFLARRLLNYIVLLALASFLAFSSGLAGSSSRWTACCSAIRARRRPSSTPRPPSWISTSRSRSATGTGWPASCTATSAPPSAGQPVSDELWRRIGVSLRLLVIGSVVGTVDRRRGRRVGCDPAVPPVRSRHHRAVAVGDQHAGVRDREPSDPRGAAGQLGARRAVVRVHRRDLAGRGRWRVEPVRRPPAASGAADRSRWRWAPIAGYSRYQRNAMLDVLGQDFIRTARAKGLTRRRALFKHGLRTALIPMATLFAYGVAGLFTGAVFTEKIFGWHGMGEWFVQGIATQDTNIVAAITVFSGVDDPVGRAAVRRHLRRARPEGAGDMTEPVTTESTTTAKSGVDVAAVRVAAHPRAAPVPAQQARGGLADAARAAVHRLLRAAAAAALQLHRSRLLRAAAATQHRPLVRHQRARPGPAGPNPARHAEIDADRRLRGVHLHDHRRDGRNDRRLLRRLARPHADVDRRPAAGRAELSC